MIKPGIKPFVSHCIPSLRSCKQLLEAMEAGGIKDSEGPRQFFSSLLPCISLVPATRSKLCGCHSEGSTLLSAAELATELPSFLFFSAHIFVTHEREHELISFQCSVKQRCHWNFDVVSILFLQPLGFGLLLKLTLRWPASPHCKDGGRGSCHDCPNGQPWQTMTEKNRSQFGGTKWNQFPKSKLKYR